VDQTPTHLDLFSGIGGFALAAQWAGFRTIGFCEIDKYCQKVLAKNFLADATSDGLNRGEIERSATTTIRDTTKGQTANGNIEGCGSSWPKRPRCYGNIFDLDGRQFSGVSLITGGFPCQPYSVAGKQRGSADDRHLWPEMLRVISEARPDWVLGENVPGIIPMELDNVLSDLERIGYACRPFVIPACAVDARHRRDRLWIVGRNMEHAGRSRSQIGYSECSEPNRQEETNHVVSSGPIVSDSNEQGSQGRDGAGVRERAGEWIAGSSDSSVADNGIAIERRAARSWWREREYSKAAKDGWGRGRKANGEWLPEPDVGRVAHGIPSRVDRLKGLGNAIVPQVAYEILREIRKLI
jgi:DNA (cytosine-5)-methyltransferase 1